MTQTITVAQGVAHVFVAVDHCNSECVGIHADKSANRFQALEPVRQGVRRHFAAIGKDVAALVGRMAAISIDRKRGY